MNSYAVQVAIKSELKSATNKVMDLAKYQNEYANLSSILSQLQDVVKRENKRSIMKQHLTPSMLSLLEDEIIPMLENELGYAPPFDQSCGGGPTMTATRYC